MKQLQLISLRAVESMEAKEAAGQWEMRFYNNVLLSKYGEYLCSERERKIQIFPCAGNCHSMVQHCLAALNCFFCAVFF